MLKYLLKRILIFIPTLVVVSLLAFMISINAPGDPVERMLNKSQGSGEQSTNTANTIEQKRIWTHRLGFDLPVFYIGFSNIATPDTLYKISDPAHKIAAERLIHQYGNWDAISTFRQTILQLILMHDQISIKTITDTLIDKNALLEDFNQSRFISLNLLSAYNPDMIQSQIEKLEHIYQMHPQFDRCLVLIKNIQSQFVALEQKQTRWKNFIPIIHLYAYNQYHRWIFGDGNLISGKQSEYCRGILRGDFGLSYQTQLPIEDVIKTKLPWSLSFTLISVILAYVISIPIGIKSASNKNGLFDRSTSVFLFILYSMPAFWFATLLLMTFANPAVLKIFPASGVQPITGIPDGSNFFQRIQIYFPYLVLPTICYTYAQLAFLSRITRVSILEIVSQDYIRTARAKGLNESKVIYKHAFRNALLPIITVFSNIFPVAIGGSVILETIFTIPGMGKEIFLAISSQDIPMIISIFTITGILTLIGYLVADILYAIADPRISIHK